MIVMGCDGNNKLFPLTFAIMEGENIDCNTPKYTIVVFDMFRVFCKHNLKVS